MKVLIFKREFSFLILAIFWSANCLPSDEIVTKPSNLSGSTGYILFLERKLSELELSLSEIEERNLNLVRQLDDAYDTIKKNETQIRSNLDTGGVLSNRVNQLEYQAVSELKAASHFASNTSVMLTGVGVLVTVLGVGIAIFAFIGLADIKKAAIDAAIKESKKGLEKAISEGKLNDSIYSATGHFMYRHIMSEKDFPEERDEDESK